MAHKEQQDFCYNVVALHPKHFSNKKVLDVGSLDINGNNRLYFTGCDYTGIDLGTGNNVDVITKTHNFKPDVQYDTIISTECFEHDLHYELSLQNIVQLLKPGGLFLFSCATEGREEHGTRKTKTHDLSPFTAIIWPDYYRNLSIEDIRNVLDVDDIFIDYQFSINTTSKDLYFWGIKK
jgi:2-polyprenyl-3-methyl-5-hydroxy-6-metoxy-1,4-benzoquinol methylase